MSTGNELKLIGRSDAINEDALIIGKEIACWMATIKVNSVTGNASQRKVFLYAHQTLFVVSLILSFAWSRHSPIACC